jgi:hypothetical protein
MSRIDDDFDKKTKEALDADIEEFRKRGGDLDEPNIEADVITDDPEPVEDQDTSDTNSESETVETETSDEDLKTTAISNTELLNEMRQIKAEFERQRLETEKWRFVASREAGKRGFEKDTKQKKSDFSSDLSDLAGEVTDKTGKTETDEDREWRTEQRGNIVLQEVGHLTEEVADFPEIAEAVQHFIAQKRPAYADALDNGSPSTIRKATQMLYKEAVLDARAYLQQEKQTIEQTRRQDTATKVMAKKQASAPPKSSPSNAGVKKASTTKGGNEPTHDELIAEYKRRRDAGIYLD